MIEVTDVIPVQGETATGHEFGYIRAGKGGFFFTWRYDFHGAAFNQRSQVVDTIVPDSVNPPTGRGNLKRQAVLSLREYISTRGLRKIPATADR